MLFASWHPGELWLAVGLLLVGVATILLGVAALSRLRDGGWRVFAVIPAFLSVFIFCTSWLTLLSGALNRLVLVIGVLVAAAATYFFAALVHDTLNDGSPTERNALGILQWRPLLLVLSLLLGFYIVSIDHNYVPAQFDATTYLFLGDVLERHGTYPLVEFAGQHELTILPPPGYFAFDYAFRQAWDHPRWALVGSTLVLMCLVVAFAWLTAILFKEGAYVAAVGVAVFCRPLYWNFWEFNLPRHLSLVSVLMCLIGCVYAYRSKTWSTKGLGALAFAMACLSGAILTHPENAAYLLVGVIVVAFVAALIEFASNRDRALKLMGIVAVGIAVSAVSGLAWYSKVLTEAGAAGFLARAYKSPLPDLSNLLFHTNGVLPLLLFGVGVGWLLVRGKLHLGLGLAAIFLVMLGCAYGQAIFPLLWPQEYAFSTRPFNQFSGAGLYADTPLIHPHSLIVKIYGLWWFMVPVSAWTYSRVWEAVKERRRRVVALVLFGGLAFADVMYLYYNKPIVSLAQHDFLLQVKEVVPAGAVIVAPPQYHFGAWVGPLVHRDCLAFRGKYHTRNSISDNLDGVLRDTYENGSFDSLLEMVGTRNVVILFDSAYAHQAEQLLGTEEWTELVKTGTNVALRPVAEGSLDDVE